MAHCIATEVLQQERHAGERPVGQAALDGLHRDVVLQAGDRADGGIEGFDACHRRIEQLVR
jgi:hypothetical protein